MVGSKNALSYCKKAHDSLPSSNCNRISTTLHVICLMKGPNKRALDLTTSILDNIITPENGTAAINSRVCKRDPLLMLNKVDKTFSDRIGRTE